jgi:hypothetical protein
MPTLAIETPALDASTCSSAGADGWIVIDGAYCIAWPSVNVCGAMAGALVDSCADRPADGANDATKRAAQIDRRVIGHPARLHRYRTSHHDRFPQLYAKRLRNS